MIDDEEGSLRDLQNSLQDALEGRGLPELPGPDDPVVDRSTEILTQLERDVINRLGNLWNDICVIVVHGRTRDHDLAEIVIHIHALQHAIMAQAAARAYPEEFRLMGGTIEGVVDV